MPRSGFIVLALAGGLAFAQTFAFQIGSPVAAQDFHFKSAAFVFRTTGCADPAKPEITATLEGIDAGVRQSKDLRIAKSSKPGVYAVTQQWNPSGHWVVALKGACGEVQAGAIVPVGRNDFVRDASKFFSHSPTSAEIDAALKAFPEGGYK